MGQYNKAIITAAGESLIARAIVGEIQLEITKAKTSVHKYPDSTDFKALTDMQGIKQVMNSPDTKVLSNDLIQTRTLFSNEEIQSTYYIQNIGLYAMDGTQEVLFCIVTAATPDEMPQYNGVAATSYIYNIQSAVQDAETIHITVNPAGNATIQDVMERVDSTGGDISETVIETLDPTDIKYPIPTAGEKVKTFFGKILTFLKNIKPLEADITIYVATTGSDTTGDGSEAAPYKTITYALSEIPKVLNGYTASVIIAGGTYAEDLVLKGFTGDLQFLLQGNTNVNSVTVDNTTVACKSSDPSSHTLTAQWMRVLNYATWFSYAQVDIVTTSYAVVQAKNISISVENTSSVYMSGTFTPTGNSGVAVLATGLSIVHFGTIIGSGFNTSYSIQSGSKLTYINNSLSATSTDISSGGIFVSSYGARIGTLQNSTVLYVSTTGSDITGNGASVKPFKTIQYAINSLPKDLGGYKATIKVADGTYNETIYIQAFSGGSIALESSNTTALSSVCNIRNIVIGDCSAKVYVSGFNITNNEDQGITAYNSFVRIDYCSITGMSKSITAIYLERTTAEVYSCLVSNRNVALHANKSDVTSGSWTAGTNNNYGISSTYGSVVSTFGTQPQGTISLHQNTGGTYLNSNGTQISDIIAFGLSCTWGAIRGGYIRHGNYNSVGVAMVTVEVNILLTANLSAGAIYLINGFPSASGQDVSVSCNRPNLVDDVFLNKDGYISVKPLSSITAGIALLFNVTYATNS